MNLPKVTKSRLSDKVAEILYDQIRSGKLKAGDKLPSELELSEQLGVSRPSVREALNRLMGLGLIVRGTYTCSVANLPILPSDPLCTHVLNDWETRDLFEAEDWWNAILSDSQSSKPVRKISLNSAESTKR